jgi:hypothetical protein
MSKPAPVFRPIGPLEVPDDALNALSEQLGVPSLVRPPPAPAAKAPAVSVNESTASPPAPAEPVLRVPIAEEAPMPIEKLTIEIPGYLAQALRRDCAEKRVTNRYLVLLGLQAIGYAVEAADLVPDLRRPRYRAGRP